ncbi:MAG: T9SS type A sorting domain-containing protein [Marinilabiliaceae bacterium]|nr:T9SS type A sorting domain-containing protein [Marinilabiliaceae bacterium]
MNSYVLKAVILFIAATFTPILGITQPKYGKEIKVTINGYNQNDAMEPLISSDGLILFFNNTNDGINTNLYYALKVNDSTFTFQGELNGTNQTTLPHLDAVADMDESRHFIWTSTRNYPAKMNNLFQGKYVNGTVRDTCRVYGNFYKNITGWLTMDHGLSANGQYLYYNNARFDGTNTGPKETEIGVASKLNDSTFNKLYNSDELLKNINDARYIYYAPCISSDNLELYYARFLNETPTANTTSEICVAVRNSPIEAFGTPTILFFETLENMIEAVSIVKDKSRIYYHKKENGNYRIAMKYRELQLSKINPKHNTIDFSIIPNPSSDEIVITSNKQLDCIKITIFNHFSQTVYCKLNSSIPHKTDISNLPPGIYFVTFSKNNEIIKTQKLIKK